MAEYLAAHLVGLRAHQLAEQKAVCLAAYLVALTVCRLVH